MSWIANWWGRSHFRIVLLGTIAAILLVVAGSEPTPETATPTHVMIPLTTTTSSTSSTSTTTTTTVVTADSRRKPIPPQQISVAELPATTIPDGVRCPEMWSIISAMWPADEWANADYVAYKESGCQPDAVRAGADFGLYQINKAAHSERILADWGYTMDDLLNPEINAFMAFIIYLRGVEYTGCGWSAWYRSIDPEVLCAE